MSAVVSTVYTHGTQSHNQPSPYSPHSLFLCLCVSVYVCASGCVCICVCASVCLSLPLSLSATYTSCERTMYPRPPLAMEGARLDMFGQEELLSEDAREGMGQSIVRDIWLGQLGMSHSRTTKAVVCTAQNITWRVDQRARRCSRRTMPLMQRRRAAHT